MKRRAVQRTLTLLSLLAAQAIHAGSSEFSGNIVSGDPTMIAVTIVTPNCLGLTTTPVPYRAIPLTVDAGGTYTFAGHRTGGTAMYLYAGSFDPATPLANCIGASNTNPHNLSRTLSAGTNYVLVVTNDFPNQPVARFDINVSGPGNIHGACADFADLDAANAFCANVHWLRNRAITLGCTTATYCPNEPVTRLQMAAFMNRLGSAIAPVPHGSAGIRASRS